MISAATLKTSPWKFMFTLLLFGFFTQVGIAQSCKASLEVKKNRSFKSASTNGTTFTLLLTNNSSSRTSYSLDLKDSSKSCSNQTFKTTKQNVSLSKSLHKKGSKTVMPNNKVTVNAGETYMFDVFVSVPSGTEFKTWSCIEVIAKADGCKSSSNTVLSVYVPNPADSE